ncbi:DUF1768 domain-containing protein [Myroides sp. BIT-d1]|uniref:DUF1768 domain-containing protein n=1 Tax=Myroides albus TaxID=2562892 RepID=A0A6I3LI99_9FLAO|nr:NADAR family protein [Myroides albus]MTG98268.1 DUF1768 domain-containing protein [Myroides albus]
MKFEKQYSLKRHIEDYRKGKRGKYVFFWGHQKSKSGLITSSCFSQWWSSPFAVDGQVYVSTEHWMMAQKALLFNDVEIYNRIMQAKSPMEMKALGREVKGFKEDVWVENRYAIVVEGNYHKFNQNADLKEFLLNTKNRILVEASPVDTIWGVGLAADNEKINNPMQWNGLNLLGFALMEVRYLLAGE